MPAARSMIEPRRFGSVQTVVGTRAIVARFAGELVGVGLVGELAGGLADELATID